MFTFCISHKQPRYPEYCKHDNADCRRKEKLFNAALLPFYERGFIKYEHRRRAEQGERGERRYENRRPEGSPVEYAARSIEPARL